MRELQRNRESCPHLTRKGKCPSPTMMPEMRRNDRESGRQSRPRAHYPRPRNGKPQQGVKKMSPSPPTMMRETPDKYQLGANGSPRQSNPSTLNDSSTH